MISGIQQNYFAGIATTLQSTPRAKINPIPEAKGNDYSKRVTDSSVTVSFSDNFVGALTDSGLLNPVALSEKENLNYSQFSDKKSNSQSESKPTSELEGDDELILKELKESDTDVRHHEMSHVAASGGLAGAPTYVYQQGADGQMYAVGGHVNIAIGEGSTPEETVQNARKVRAGAMAVTDPSSQDISVAAKAIQMESSALKEMNEIQLEAIVADSGELVALENKMDSDKKTNKKTAVDKTPKDSKDDAAKILKSKIKKVYAKHKL